MGDKSVIWWWIKCVIGIELLVWTAIISANGTIRRSDMKSWMGRRRSVDDVRCYRRVCI